MRASLQLRLGQQLAMTPQLRQAIGLLQLSALELQQEIRQTLEANVMLEVDAEPLGPNSEADIELAEHVPDPADDGASDGEWELPDGGLGDEWPDHDGGQFSGGDFNTLENYADAAPDLKDHLAQQIRFARLPDAEAQLAAAIIESLEDDGYLREPLDELAAAENQPVELAEEVLARIQLLDPPGVGARNLSECLLAQLRLKSPGPGRELAMRIVERHLEQMARQSTAALAAACGSDLDMVEEALAMIRELDPKPGDAIGEQRNDYVIPDLLLIRNKGRWQVELNVRILPRVRLNTQYVRLMRQASDKSPEMQAQLQEARWLIRSLSVRNDTLSRVAALAVDAQQDYFDNGDEAMRPLLLKDVAEQAEVHESTVSRVTANKYLHTPRGTIPLKFLFSQPLQNKDGAETSPVAVRAVIRNMIQNENPSRPMSDRRIADELTERGIEVARRTVTKYREAMRIPASYLRKSVDTGTRNQPVTR
ncbi:MAG: RNA polymerase factor sigma-54 [Gammaproteobacteria bacterium]|nr:RNA polymerase factor sigma-54 [Gammaproteobacteria bacterium]